MITYTLDTDTYAVYIIDGDELLIEQLTYPNGDSFDSLEEADNWAQAAVASYDPETPRYAPNGKGIEGELKPSIAEMNEWHRRRIALDPTLEEFASELIKEEI